MKAHGTFKVHIPRMRVARFYKTASTPMLAKKFLSRRAAPKWGIPPWNISLNQLLHFYLVSTWFRPHFYRRSLAFIWGANGACKRGSTAFASYRGSRVTFRKCY
jgi:hypothetical protein